MSPWWSYGLAAVGIAGLLLAGSPDRVRRQAGWIVGFLAQGLWIVYAVVSDQPGFIATALAYGAVYFRNAVKAREPELRSRRRWRIRRYSAHP